MGGPLDRWLQRRPPLEPVQPQSPGSAGCEARNQQTAEPPHSAEQPEAQEQWAPDGTLHSYFAPIHSSSSQDALDSADAPRKRNRLAARDPLDWQLTGAMHRGSSAQLYHRHVSACRQRAIFESHAWQRQVLGGGTLPPEEAGCIQCAVFDSGGELLVCGSEEGLLTVHSTAQLLAACAPPGPLAARAKAAAPPAQQPVGTGDPLLVLYTHMPKLQAVKWNPANENVVGVASSATRQLHLYDLQHTQGQPKQVLTIPSSASSSLSGSTAVGLTDLAFFGGNIASSSSSGGGSGSGGGYVLLASGQGGQVFLWDARAKATPTATLQAAQSGAIYALQLSPDEQVVMAGTQSGEVKLWDLRGGSSSTLRFGGTVHHHPLLAAHNLRYALTGVPGLASQTTIPASAVHSMQLDPSDPRRLAFHLGCSWSGVLHLGSGAVTHLHAPAHAFADEPSEPRVAMAAGGEGAGAAATLTQMLLWASTAAPTLHRRACWTHDARRYCVPSRRDDSLMLLDFSDSPAAGCYALQEDDGGSGRGTGQGYPDASSQGHLPAVPSAVHVQLSQAAICAAAHPHMDLLVAGSLGSTLSVAGLF